MSSVRKIGLAIVLLGSWLAFANTAPALADAPEAAAPTPAATDAQRPQIDESVERMLKDMAAASTWGHPDLYGEFGGMQAYAKGDYKTALTDFKYGALYADKLSQLTIGLMYDGGLGVARDSATGCAWLMLAAERKIPKFVATRDKVCDALAPGQHATANAVFAELAPKYGDAVAKLRIKRVFADVLRNRTGSRTGFDMGATTHNVGYRSQCDGNTILHIAGVDLPRDGCTSNKFWAPDNWNPDIYFADRDARWYSGSVNVEPVKPSDEKGSNTVEPDKSDHPR